MVKLNKKELTLTQTPAVSISSSMNRIKTVTDHEYYEPYPTLKDWFKKKINNLNQTIKNYFLSYLPFLDWIYRYNLVWFWSDLIAGLTVGAIVIPQGMAYAGLAKLAPQFGLYSSFVGVMIYWFFATSKDVSIGPVAVVSALTGNVVDAVRRGYPTYESHTIASALSLISGCIIFSLGMFRLGFIVDFIPLPALAAFMTGSALKIAMGQIPVMMGNNKYLNTRESIYLIFGQFWKQIKHCDLNAVLGLTSLVLLYLIRFICAHASRRFPTREKVFFFISTLRVVFVIILFLFISWLINRHHPDHPRTSILGKVPRGFQNLGVPYIDRTLLGALASYLPSTVIVLLIEHIAIAKSFGRINNYNIDSNQELIAIGVTNIFGPFFGAYPATGAFSRTAIKSKAGVRTPLAGLFSGLLIILGIYTLTSIFYWISQACLAAVIIHGVGDLIVGPQTLKRFWRANPVEFFIFWIGVIVTIFSNIETGLYITTISSGCLLLFRIAKPRGEFVGRVQVQQVKLTSDGYTHVTTRNIYVPLNHSDGSNPTIIPILPGNGIFIYRVNESFLYPNANNYMEQLVEKIFRETKPGKVKPYGSLGEQPWNLKTSRHPEKDLQKDDQRPHLHALILDFTGVAHLDITGLESLVDVRRQLDRYADKTINWHFVGLSNPWMKRALISAGFGSSDHGHTVFSVANVYINLDHGENDADIILVPILDINRPLFHADLDEAYEAAMATVAQQETFFVSRDDTATGLQVTLF
ncbi:unnamed protein product [Rotaria sordida]|uniref:STAS domain-containing protein n=1 Tax=Rotaria sordida TaxID=392033 RepID=A0A818LA27_9BILA|nr:unnamed protein product [Rotaria sordida]CAF3573835.1 unnamed protein product [Rotaria sordida]